MIHFVTSKIRGERCQRCHRLRVIGYAEGVPYRVDPVPLTVRAELAARIAGRGTYALTGGTMVWRSPERIGGDVRRGRAIVFADHRCQHPAAPVDVDTRYLGFVARTVSALESDGPVSAIEMSALVMLGDVLGARVIDDPPY